MGGFHECTRHPTLRQTGRKGGATDFKFCFHGQDGPSPPRKFTKSAEESKDERTVQRRAGNLTTLLVASDRSRYKDRHARIIIVARRKISHERPDTFTQTASSPHSNPLAVMRRTIHYRRCALSLRPGSNKKRMFTIAGFWRRRYKIPSTEACMR